MSFRLSLAFSVIGALGSGSALAARAPQARSAPVARWRATPKISAVASKLSRRLDHASRALTQLAAGIEGRLDEDAPSVATHLYHLEMHAIDVVRSIADLSPREATPEQRARLLDESLSLLRRVMYQKDHVVGPFALRVVRAADPGEPMARRVTRDGRDTYLLLDRSPSIARSARVVARTREELYQDRLGQFVAQGGKPGDIVPMSAAFVGSVPSGATIAWAHRAGDQQIWVSTNAKHVVTAGGDDALGAGEIKIYKNRFGEVLLALVSNSSGAVKSGPGSLEAVASRLRALGVPDSRIVYTQFNPAEPQLLRLLLIADKSLSKQQICERVSAVTDGVPGLDSF